MFWKVNPQNLLDTKEILLNGIIIREVHWKSRKLPVSWPLKIDRMVLKTQQSAIIRIDQKDQNYQKWSKLFLLKLFKTEKQIILREVPHCEKNGTSSKLFLKRCHHVNKNTCNNRIKWVTKNWDRCFDWNTDFHTHCLYYLWRRVSDLPALQNQKQGEFSKTVWKTWRVIKKPGDFSKPLLS